MRGRAAAALVILVAAAGCRGDGKSAATTTTTAGAAATSSTSVEAAPTTSVPDPATRGEDFDRVFREVVGFSHFVYQHPDPALLDVIYDSSANTLPNVRGQIENLRSRGYRYDDEGQTVHSVEVEKRQDPTHVLLRVVTSHGEQRIVDAQGNVVQRGTGWPKRQEQYLLELGEDGRWRIQYKTTLGPA